MSIQKSFIIFMVLLSTVLGLNATDFTKTASAAPQLLQESKGKNWCNVCGMNLKMFYKTNHAATMPNDTHHQYCSLRCLAVDMQNHTINKDTIKVIDVKTEKFIPAKRAFYVVNSKVKGTMSKVSKLAFASKNDADAFVKKYKGQVVDFDEALELAQKSLRSDTMMITKKKKKKIYPMGKKIVSKMCNSDIDVKKYTAINELKSAMKNENLCRPLKEKQLQAAALYLWEVKRLGDADVHNATIHVTKDDKCPVCGMFTYKYPKWTAQMFYEDSGEQKHYSFDGVKDLMKFYFSPKKWGNNKIENKDDITKILVTDYYSQIAIDATKAYYVVGSDTYGPMGDEFIPFAHEDDAKTFYMDHKGTKILQFKDITQKEVYKLDE